MAIEDAKFIVGSPSADLNNELLSNDIMLTNAVRNGSFESWSAGDTEAPDEWTDYATTGIKSKESTEIYFGSHSMELGSTTVINTAIGQEIDHKEKFTVTVSFGCWVKCSTASKARLCIADGVGNDYSSFHTGDGTWQFLVVSRSCAGAVSHIRVFCQVELATSGTVTAYFDGAIAMKHLGSSGLIFAFVPHVFDEGGNIYGNLTFKDGKTVKGLPAASAAGQAVRYEQSSAGILTTQGDLLYRGASTGARLAKGTARQKLQTNSGATAPEWLTGGVYVPREVSTYDFSTPVANGIDDDSDWHVNGLDLSSAGVPTGAVAAHLGLSVSGASAGMQFYIRRNASTGTYNYLLGQIFVATYGRQVDGIISLDSDLKIDYYATEHVNAYLTVRGWFI